ncbi:MAG: MFS transporter [Rhodospirillales bacterium]|nr:MFS transporter [Rhodospirillales bacterium]
MSKLRAYAAFTLAALYFGHEFVQRVSTSVVVGDLMAEFAVGGAVLGSLSAFYFYAYASMQIPVGVLMDRFGPRRLMSFAAGISACGALLFAAAPAIQFAYLGRAMIGFGASFSWIGILTVATLWLPPSRFSAYAGLGQAAGMAGAILGQAPLAMIVESLGWRLSVGLLALVGGAVAAGIFLTVPDVPKRPRQVHTRLTDSLKIAASNPQTWLNAVFGLSMTGTMLSFSGLWAVPWLISVYGFERAGAAALTSSMFIGWAVGSPLIGWLADRAGRLKPFQVGCGTGMCLTLIALVYIPALPTAVLGTLMFTNGIFASGMVLAYGAARAHNPPEASGATYGLVNTGVVGSGAIFQPLIGLFLDLNWGGAMQAGARVYSASAYEIAFTILPAAAAVGTLAAMLTREKRPV